MRVKLTSSEGSGNLGGASQAQRKRAEWIWPVGPDDNGSSAAADMKSSFEWPGSDEIETSGA